MFYYSTIVFICFLLTVSCNSQSNQSLSAIDFKKKIQIDTAAQILDVRTPTEFNAGHLKKALLANWSDQVEFERRISFLDKTKSVYIYCLSGIRSEAAMKYLVSKGFKHVFHLKGGIKSWKSENLPIEGSTNKTQMSINHFNELIKTNSVVLVDFGAEWCPPCKKMEPIINKISNEHKAKFYLLKVDGGNDIEVMKQYHVEALPVFIIFKNGKQVWRKDGIADEKEIVENL